MCRCVSCRVSRFLLDRSTQRNAINILGVQNGTITYSVFSISCGGDTEELFEQHQKEIELAKQYGIELAYQPFGTKLPVEANIVGGEEDEDA